MAEKIDIILNLDDNATAGLKKAGNEVKSFTDKAKGSFTEFAAKIFIVSTAIKGTVATIKSFTDAAGRQEDAINRLNTQLQLNGDFSKQVSLDLQEYARSIQEVTRFGDEAILEQLSFAMAMGATAEQAKEVVSAATDMATSLNVDLNTATRNVAKTLGGYAGELGEVIPELKNLTQEQLRAGDGVRLLASQFSGAAASDINTFSGKVDQLSNAWGDFREEIGKFITQGDGANNIVSALTTAIEFWTNKITQANIEIEKQHGILGNLEDQLERINELMEQNLDKQSAPFLINRNKIEEDYNNLLQRRSEIILTIQRVREQQLEQETIDVQESINQMNVMQDSHVQEYQKQLDRKKQGQKQALNDISSLTSTAFSEQNALTKTARSAQALINTYAAANNALASVPFPFNLAAAAVVTAAGLANVAQIAGIGFAEGTDTVPANLTPGEMVVPRTFAEAIRRGDLSLSGPGSGGSDVGQVNIYIQGGIRSDGASVEEMAEELGFEFERQIRSAR